MKSASLHCKSAEVIRRLVERARVRLMCQITINLSPGQIERFVCQLRSSNHFIKNDDFSAFHFLNFFLILFSFLNLCKESAKSAGINRTDACVCRAGRCHFVRGNALCSADINREKNPKVWRIINWAKPVFAAGCLLAIAKHMELLLLLPSSAPMHLELVKSTLGDQTHDLLTLECSEHIFLLLAFLLILSLVRSVARSLHTIDEVAVVPNS